MARWSATWAVRGFEFPELPVASPSDIDEFLEDGSGNQATREGCSSWAWDEDDEEKEDTSNGEESKKFWESQYQLLQVKLSILLVPINFQVFGERLDFLPFPDSPATEMEVCKYSKQMHTSCDALWRAAGCPFPWREPKGPCLGCSNFL